jgi:hypothetical protein
MLAVVLLALATAGLAAVWPTLAILIPLLCVTCALAVRAPTSALLLALLVLGSVGTIKARFLTESVPSPDETGAVLIDLFLLAAVVGLVARDRGRSVRMFWSRAGRAEHVVWSVLVAWLVLSVAQIAQGDRLVDALQGFRLTQAYVVFLVIGLIFAHRVAPRPERFVAPLLAVLAVISGYAALRWLTGPSAWESAFALQRTEHSEFGELARTLGSFSSPTEIASFLVPVSAFALIVGCLHARLRLLGLATFVMATTAVIYSYVRVGVVAIAAAALVMALVIVLSRAPARRTKVLALALVLVIGGGTYGAAVTASDKSAPTSERARGFSDPLEDESLQIRWGTWERTVEQIRDEPLGSGLGTVGNAATVGRRLSFTDNYYLKVAREQGIFGVLLFVVGLVGTVVLLGVRLARSNPLKLPLGVAALGTGAAVLTMAVLGEYLEGPGKVLIWLVLGMGLWETYCQPVAGSGTAEPTVARAAHHGRVREERECDAELA